MGSDRVANFSAGPACLPVEVLTKIQSEMLNWNGAGMGVMEMSHRGPHFTKIYADTVALIREVIGIPEEYAVLFATGGATGQFASIPLNLLGDKKCADYIVTGAWGEKAVNEAKKYCDVNVVANSKDIKHEGVPSKDTWQFNPDAAYVHYTTNETIHGIQFPDIIDVPSGVPLVADMSSDFCSRPIDVRKHAVIYAGAQKNIGPAGVTVVIIRRDLLGKARADTPIVCNYKTLAENDSMYNTPPTFGIYICGLMFEWIKSMGGLEKMEQHNRNKAKLIYDVINAHSAFFRCPVVPEYQSMMNIPVRLPSEDLEKEFLKSATAAELVELKGHRSVGGIRVSLYNAMPVEFIERLATFMEDFACKNQ